VAKSKDKVDKFERNKRLASKKQFRDTEQHEIRNMNRLGHQWDASGMEWDDEDEGDSDDIS